MRLTERMRRDLGTERSARLLPDGPVFAGKYVVRIQGKVALDAQGEWLTFDNLGAAQRYYNANRSPGQTGHPV